MRARILDLGDRVGWVAVSSSGGWPLRVRRAWGGRNESDDRVLHAGVLVLGRSVEIRLGLPRSRRPLELLARDLRRVGRELGLEVLLDAADAIDSTRERSE